MVIDVNLAAAAISATDSSFEDQEEDAGSVNSVNSLLTKLIGNSATTQDPVPDLTTSEPNTTMTAQSLTVSSNAMATLPITANIFPNNTSTMNDAQPRTGSFKQRVTLVDSSRVSNLKLASTVTAVASVTPTPKSTVTGKRSFSAVTTPTPTPSPTNSGGKPMANSASPPSAVNTPMRQVSKDARIMSPIGQLLTPE